VRRFAEIGRVCLINYGPSAGKLCTIIDIVDANSALVDGPTPLTGVSRQVINFRRVNLTDLKVDIQRNARQSTLMNAWKKADILEKWNNSAWAKKIEQKKTRAALNDFDRFKVMLAKKAKRHEVAKQFRQLKKNEKSEVFASL